MDTQPAATSPPSLPPQPTRPQPTRLRSTAAPLLAAWAALIVYASLFPFDGWRLPSGSDASDWMTLPWPTWRDRFDELANLIGYLPFGALACGWRLRQGASSRRAVLIALALAMLLSYLVELTQHFLPVRVPSLKDTLLNVLGAGIGAAGAVVLFHGGLMDQWQRVRERWFENHGSVAMALLLLWPLGLTVPAPVPLGLGRTWEPAAAVLREFIEGTVLEPYVVDWLTPAKAQTFTLAAEHELLIVAAGLLAPVLLAYAMTIHAKRRLVLACGAMVLGILATTLSVALSFGPEHALAWVTPNVLLGLSVALVLAMLMAALPARSAAWLGVSVMLILVWAVGAAPADSYYAHNLSIWEQGRFVRFHGLSQWVAWLWPYAAALWLAVRAPATR